MQAWHITQWHKYERADTRKTNNMTWYAKQTKLIGRGIGATIKLPYPKNAQLLGIWVMIETLASMSEAEHRGWLVRDFEPMDAAMMSDLMPFYPPAAFQEGLDHFSRKDINWLERGEFSAARPAPGFSPVKSPAVLPMHGESPVKSPAVLPANSGAVANTGGNSGTDRQTDRQTDSTERERERYGGFASKETAKSAQDHQYAAAQVELKPFAKAGWEDLTVVQQELVKKNRALLKAIRTKQKKGDFTPVEERI